VISPFGRAGSSHVKEASAPSVVALGVSTPSGTEMRRREGYRGESYNTVPSIVSHTAHAPTHPHPHMHTCLAC